MSYSGWQEIDYFCSTCADKGEIRGLHRDGRMVNCPECSPTPRQRRRQPLVEAWETRRFDRWWKQFVAGGVR